MACGSIGLLSVVLSHETGLDLSGPGGYHVSVHSANPGNRREKAVWGMQQEMWKWLLVIAVVARTADQITRVLTGKQGPFPLLCRFPRVCQLVQKVQHSG